MFPNERESRRFGVFREGVRVVLADGESWAFPAPDRTPSDAGTKAQLEELATAILETDAEPDRSLAILALSIFLLRSNYRLEPNELQRLLTFRPGSPEEAAWRRQAMEIAVASAPGAPGCDLSTGDWDASAFHRAFHWLIRWVGRWRPLLSSRR